MTLQRNAGIRAVEFHLPERIESGADLLREFPEWPVGKIEAKTGILRRHIAAAGECASDLAVHAARKLFASGACTPADIDFVLLCTQTPDYLLPSSACLIQEQLEIPVSAGALDFNLGSSGFVYGLAVAQGLIATGSARKVLLLTADTYSKLLHPADKSVRTIFGDGAAATLVSMTDGTELSLGPFVFGTDGKGAENLIVPAGGMRKLRTAETQAPLSDASGNVRTAEHLFMDGGEIFAFALGRVPGLVKELLAKAGKTAEEIDLFVPHQPNRFMLEALRKQLRIPPERFVIYLEDCGNTVSATIPIALRAAQEAGTLKSGHLVMLIGFGVGYSWGATLVRWP